MSKNYRVDTTAGEERDKGVMQRSGSRYLLFEVADGIFVGVSEEIEDVVFDVVLLQVVHQVGAVALCVQKNREKTI